MESKTTHTDPTPKHYPVWVNCADRMPDEKIMEYGKGSVFIRNIQTKHGGMIFISDLQKITELSNVEWLDEPHPTPSIPISEAVDISKLPERPPMKEFIEFLSGHNKFYVEEVRIWHRLLLSEQISFSRFVELFNEKIFKIIKP